MTTITRYRDAAIVALAKAKEARARQSPPKDDISAIGGRGAEQMLETAILVVSDMFDQEVEGKRVLDEVVIMLGTVTLSIAMTFASGDAENADGLVRQLLGRIEERCTQNLREHDPSRWVEGEICVTEGGRRDA